MATMDQVRAAHDADPRASAEEIAISLGCSAGYVRATARRLGVRIIASNRPASISKLGQAARDAGMTLADIDAWARANQRSEDNGEENTFCNE